MFSHSGNDLTFLWRANNKLIDPKQNRILTSAFSLNQNQSPFQEDGMNIVSHMQMMHFSLHTYAHTQAHTHTPGMPCRSLCQPHASWAENYPLVSALAVFEERTLRQTKVLHYFHSQWDPPTTFYNCLTEKAFGRINNYQLLQYECQLFKYMFTDHHALQTPGFRSLASEQTKQELMSTKGCSLYRSSITEGLWQTRGTMCKWGAFLKEIQLDYSWDAWCF